MTKYILEIFDADYYGGWSHVAFESTLKPKKLKAMILERAKELNEFNSSKEWNSSIRDYNAINYTELVEKQSALQNMKFGNSIIRIDSSWCDSDYTLEVIPLNEWFKQKLKFSI
jgi:hypothetical protein